MDDGLWIEWSEPGGRGGRLALDRPLRIGRDAGNDITIKSRAASRGHATLSVGPHGIEVDARQSMNGIRTARGREMAASLRPGDSFSIGDARFQVAGDGVSGRSSNRSGSRARSTSLAPTLLGVAAIVAVLLAVVVPVLVVLLTGSSTPAVEDPVRALERRDPHALVAAFGGDSSDPVLVSYARDLLSQLPEGARLRVVTTGGALESAGTRQETTTYALEVVGQPAREFALERLFVRIGDSWELASVTIGPPG